MFINILTETKHTKKTYEVIKYRHESRIESTWFGSTRAVKIALHNAVVSSFEGESQDGRGSDIQVLRRD